MDTVRELDIGVELLVTLKDPDGAVEDVSDASVIRFRFRKPDGTEISRTGSLKTDGTDGKVSYTSVENDFDQVGLWRYQVYVEAGSTKRTSTQTSFRVQDAIGRP